MAPWYTVSGSIKSNTPKQKRHQLLKIKNKETSSDNAPPPKSKTQNSTPLEDFPMNKRPSWTEAAYFLTFFLFSLCASNSKKPKHNKLLSWIKR